MLPLETFDEIEDIITHNGQSADEKKSTFRQTSNTRRMADIYKRVREISTKYGNSEVDIDEMVNRYVSKAGSKRKNPFEMGKNKGSFHGRNNSYAHNSEANLVESYQKRLNEMR